MQQCVHVCVNHTSASTHIQVVCIITNHPFIYHMVLCKYMYGMYFCYSSKEFLIINFFLFIVVVFYYSCFYDGIIMVVLFFIVI